MVAQVKAVTRTAAEQVAAVGAQDFNNVTLSEALFANAALGAHALADAPAQGAAQIDANGDALVAVAAAEAATDLRADAAPTASVVPTAAPTGASIGELAQASTESKTDSGAAAPADAGTAAPADAATSAPADATATTPAPAADAAVAAEAEGGGLSGWAIGGLALLGVGAAVAIGNSGSSSDSPVAAAPPPTVPPPVTPPPPPPPPPSTIPTGFTEATGAQAGTGTAKIYFKDTADVGHVDGQIDAGERTIILNTTNGHYYELVDNGSAISQSAASSAATLRGGHLMTGDGAGEIGFVAGQYGYNPAAGGAAKVFGGIEFTDTLPALGAWVGATQDVSDNWTWDNVDGTAGGTALSSTDAAWIVHDTGNAEPNGTSVTQGFAAMSGGNPSAGAGAVPSQVLYDEAPNVGVGKYVVEYETLASIKDPAGNALSIDGNSLFASQGGSETAVAQSSPSIGISHMIDDLNVA